MLEALQDGRFWQAILIHARYGLFSPVAVQVAPLFLFPNHVREDERGAVYFWDHELRPANPESYEGITRLADSFTEFLAGLIEPIE